MTNRFAPYKHLALGLGLLAAFITTPVLAAPDQQQRCAIGLRLEQGYGQANVIRMYASINNQFDVELDASVCTGLISQGWFGVSKYGEWQRRSGGAFRPICRVDWSWGDSVIVYGPTYGDLSLAFLDCAWFTNNSDGAMTDMTSVW